MNFRDEAFSIAKIIRTAPERGIIRDFIRDVTFRRVNPDGTPINRDRTQIGYYVNELQAQFLGFLILKAQDMKAVQLLRIPALSEDELHLMARGHKTILAINQALVSPLEVAIPQAAVSVLPYSEYIYNIEPSIKPLGLFEDLDLTNIVSAFGQHPGMKILRTIPDDISNRITSDHWRHLVHQTFVDLIRRKRTDILFDFQPHLIDRSNPAAIVIHAALGLLSLRESVRTLNQLLYQAFWQDVLPSISARNIIAVRNSTVTATGPRLRLHTQFVDITSVGILTYVSSPDLGPSPGGLAVVNGFDTQYSRESGMTTEYELLPVDQYLNPYRGLVSGY